MIIYFEFCLNIICKMIEYPKRMWEYWRFLQKYCPEIFVITLLTSHQSLSHDKADVSGEILLRM